MTKDDVIRLAGESGWTGIYSQWISPTEREHLTVPVTMEQIEAFANLVAEHEREACAKMVEDSWMAFSRAPNCRLDLTPFPELSYVAKAIRARGEA